MNANTVHLHDLFRGGRRRLSPRCEIDRVGLDQFKSRSSCELREGLDRAANFCALRSTPLICFLSKPENRSRLGITSSVQRPSVLPFEFKHASSAHSASSATESVSAAFRTIESNSSSRSFASPQSDRIRSDGEQQLFLISRVQIQQARRSQTPMQLPVRSVSVPEWIRTCS